MNSICTSKREREREQNNGFQPSKTAILDRSWKQMILPNKGKTDFEIKLLKKQTHVKLCQNAPNLAS